MCKYFATDTTKADKDLIILDRLSENLKNYTLNLTDNSTNQPQDSTFSALKNLATHVESAHLIDNNALNFLSKKFDISNKLFQQYDAQGKRITTQQLSQTGYNIFATLLYQRLRVAYEANSTNDVIAQYLNVCLKAIDRIEKDFFLTDFLKDTSCRDTSCRDTSCHNTSFHDIINQLMTQSAKKTVQIEPLYRQELYSNNDSFTVLPIDVLFYEGPIARAYLATLHQLKLKPRRIIQLISENNLATGKKIGTFLPTKLRHLYASATQARQIHYWPHKILKTHPELSQQIFSILEETLDFNQHHVNHQINLAPLNHYTDMVVTLPIISLKDERLLNFLKSQDTKNYLFTGGGIVPAEFFELKNTHFLHIHPGYLPDIRGADCLLWSVLLTGNPSATCFYLNAGIDTGDIIHASWLPKIKLPSTIEQLDTKTTYRLLYGFVDPWVRCYILRETLIKTNLFKNIAPSPQSAKIGKTFHFMHDDLKQAVYKKFMQ